MYTLQEGKGIAYNKGGMGATFYKIFLRMIKYYDTPPPDKFLDPSLGVRQTMFELLFPNYYITFFCEEFSLDLHDLYWNKEMFSF